MKAVQLKRSLLLVGLFLFVIAQSCKKAEEPSTFDKIVGKWVGVEVYYEEFPPGQPANNESEDISSYNFEFKTDGTFITDSAGFDSETYRWSVGSDGNFIWYWGPNDADVLQIPVLNDSQLHLEEKGEYDNGSGVMIPYREVIKLRK